VIANPLTSPLLLNPLTPSVPIDLKSPMSAVPNCCGEQGSWS
jgi:hypothetical protein